MRIENTDIPGCARLWLEPRIDARGSFVKTFHADTFADAGMRSDFREEFITTSAPGVLRGMHLQVPPADHAKLVTCLAGQVLDVLLDVRVGSPTFGQHETFELDGDEPSALYVPPGLAHGFLVTGGEATMSYLVTSEHAPDHDVGIRWDGFGFTWPIEAPELSLRDAEHPRLEDFASPFRYVA